MAYSLYYLKNIDSDEIRYVGITTGTLKKRLSGHLHASTKDSNTYPVVQWIRKHGKENIEIVLSKEFETHEELLQAEIDTIKKLRNEGLDLLNRTDGGEGRLGSTAWNKGIPMSEEQKELLRKINTGRVLTDSQKDAIRGGVEKHFSENGHKSIYDYWEDSYGTDEANRMRQEMFEKRSASLSGEGNPMYGRRGESAPCFGRVGEKHPMFGKHHSNEAKKKIGDAFRGKKLSIEVKVNMSKAQHKRAHSDKGLEKPSCVWCNGSTVEQEITRRRSLEDDINLEGTVPTNR